MARAVSVAGVGGVGVILGADGDEDIVDIDDDDERAVLEKGALLLLLGLVPKE